MASVIFFCSASGRTRLSPSIIVVLPISSPSALFGKSPRMPENVMTVGQPKSAEALMPLVMLSVQKSQFSRWFQPFIKPWLLAMAQVRPYFLRIGQSAGGQRLAGFYPPAGAVFGGSSVVMGLKHH